MAYNLIDFDLAAAAVRKVCESGAGLLVVSGEKANPMTLGWCMVGPMWGMTVLMAPVRKSRYSHGLIEKTGEFSICLPVGGKQITSVCGSKSGRDCDKVALCGLSEIQAKELKIPCVSGCSIYIECEVVGSCDMNAELFKAVTDQWYKDGDMHTLFFGKIKSAYTVE